MEFPAEPQCYWLSVNSNDLIPVSVSSIMIVKPGQSFQPVTQTLLDSNFVNRSTIVYSSILECDPNLLEGNINTLFFGNTTGELQAFVQGVNTQQIEITNDWFIAFTNECCIFPIFSVGDAIGWLEIIDFSFPVNQ